MRGAMTGPSWFSVPTCCRNHLLQPDEKASEAREPRLRYCLRLMHPVLLSTSRQVRKEILIPTEQVCDLYRRARAPGEPPPISIAKCPHYGWVLSNESSGTRILNLRGLVEITHEGAYAVPWTCVDHVRKCFARG
jgi:hypothetical protein